MKKIQLLFAVFLLALAACGGGNDDPAPAPEAPEGKIAAVIDGQTLIFDGVIVSIMQFSGYRVSIAGHLSNGATLSFGRLGAPAVVGKSPLGQLSPTSAINVASILYTEKGAGTTTIFYESQCDDGSGFVEVTAQDTQNKTISGKFSGRICMDSGTGSKIITGSFNKIKYQ